MDRDSDPAAGGGAQRDLRGGGAGAPALQRGRDALRRPGRVPAREDVAPGGPHQGDDPRVSPPRGPARPARWAARRDADPTARDVLSRAERRGGLAGRDSGRSPHRRGRSSRERLRSESAREETFHVRPRSSRWDDRRRNRCRALRGRRGDPGRQDRGGRQGLRKGTPGDRREGQDRDPGLRRHPHPLRRAGDLGFRPDADGVARGDDPRHGQLRRRLRAGRPRQAGLPDRPDGRRRRHPGHGAPRGHRLAVGDLPAVSRRAREAALCDGHRDPGAPRRRARLRDGRARARRTSPRRRTTSRARRRS